jgi:hypothetical protein
VEAAISRCILPPDYVVGVGRIYNDADVIFANLSRLAAYGVRKFILSDMQSDDSSRAEIERFAKAHSDLTVFIIDDPGREILVSKVVTGLAALAAKALDALWIIPFDPDDFLWLAPGVTLDLADTDIDFIRLPWFQVHGKHIEGTTVQQWLARDQLDEVVRLTVSPGKMMFKWRDDLVIERGHHWIHSKTGRILKGVNGDDIGAAMAHIPIRSPSQLLSKLRLQAAAENVVVRGEVHKTHYTTIAAMLEQDGTSALDELIDAVWRRDQNAFQALCKERLINPRQFGYLSDLVLRESLTFHPPNGTGWQSLDKAPRIFTYRRKDSVKKQRIALYTRLQAALLRMRGYSRAS